MKHINSKMKKLTSLVVVFSVLSAVLSLGVSAISLTPSYQKLTYETNTFAKLLSSTPYYTNVGTITNGSVTKNCRGLQMRDVSGGYVSANGWVTGLAGTHVEVYIYGQASNESIDSSDNMNCNMNSDCSTVYSGSGLLRSATSVFRVNDSCTSGVSGHSVNNSYNDWSDRISF